MQFLASSGMVGLCSHVFSSVMDVFRRSVTARIAVVTMKVCPAMLMRPASLAVSGGDLYFSIICCMALSDVFTVGWSTWWG